VRARLRDALLGLEPAAAALLGTSVARVLARAWRRRGCVVLCYHAVREPGPYDDPSVVVSPGRFADQVRFLVERCEVVGLDRVLEPDSRRPRVAITFDDGYRDLLDHALPVLARHGAPSAVFCVSDVVEGRRALWTDALAAAIDRAPAGAYELPGLGPVEVGDAPSRVAAFQRARAVCGAAEEPVAASEGVLSSLPAAAPPADLYLHSDDLPEAEALGAEIGSHARTHARLSALDRDALAGELRHSHDVLGRSGRAVRAVAYPYGDAGSVTTAVVDAAREAGYQLGFTGRAGLASPAADPLAVPRVAIRCRDGSRAFRGKAAGAQPAVYARAARAVAS